MAIKNFMSAKNYLFFFTQKQCKVSNVKVLKLIESWILFQ